MRRNSAKYWPINHGAGKAPDKWPGWPDDKKLAFVLTHDVEGKKGLDRCRQLAEMEMRLGLRSSFNFVPEGEYSTPESLRDFLTANGFEVGVHDLKHNGQLFRSRKCFAANAKKINHYLAAWQAVGFRSGFMLHNLLWLQELNILYDSSTFDTDPFEPQPEGVNTIFPFWVSLDSGSGYVELPYTLPQDSTLFLVLQEPSIDIWKRKLDWVAQHGGMALVNVHPDYMSFNGGKISSEYSAHLYQDLLEYVDKRYRDQCWFALPRQVAEYVSSGIRPCADRRDIAQPTHSSTGRPSGRRHPTVSRAWTLRGKRVAMVSFSPYPFDPRPRRAAEALVNEGMCVEVICLAEDGANVRRERYNGVEILRIQLKRRRGGKFDYLFRYSVFILISFTILALRSLPRRYDLIHVHNMPDVLILSSLIPKAFGAKVILDLHDPMPELMMSIFGLPEDSHSVRFLKRLEKWSIELADLILTVNLAFKELFASRSGKGEKVHIVMNSPDEEIFRFRPTRSSLPVNDTPGKPFVIMYHGSLVERNGLDLAIEALASVRQTVPTAELRVCAPPTPFLERVMESVRAKGLGDAVRYLGPKHLEQIVEGIEECDVGIIPNHRNVFTQINMPVRIFEYLALGKPVIAPRAAGIQDYFDDESLVYFELGNSLDLARKLEYVFFHPAEAAVIMKRGQEVYLSHTWSQERVKFLSLVGELLGSGEHSD